MTYTTDEEKVEAIKAWWKANGAAVVAGVVLGLIAIFGWRAWINQRLQVAEQASSQFEQLLIAVRREDAAQANALADQLTEEFGSTSYASLGALVAARAAQASGDADTAMRHLERVLEKAPDPALERLAALSLARIQVAEGALDAAEATLKRYDDSPAFAGDFAAVRGDIAAARGNVDAARAAYEQAIAAGSGLAPLIELKLDNLPSAG
ncbi:MAG: tetratricopeptide repeat protein [Chromatiaceae bacterium]|nr:tetratricopeptide repeat protein [Chromatiaceae bacterium]